MMVSQCWSSMFHNFISLRKNIASNIHNHHIHFKQLMYIYICISNITSSSDHISNIVLKLYNTRWQWLLIIHNYTNLWLYSKINLTIYYYYGASPIFWRQWPDTAAEPRCLCSSDNGTSGRERRLPDSWPNCSCIVPTYIIVLHIYIYIYYI